MAHQCLHIAIKPPDLQRTWMATQENDDYHGEDEDEDEDSEGTGESGSTSGCEVLLPHLDSKEEVENTHAFAERRTRLAVAGQSVGAHLVSFSLNHDARKDPPLENACPHKLFFKIDGASSNCVRNAWKRAGFERTNKGGWNLWWGRPLKFPEHKKLNEYQKVCHFPGTYYLGRKDNLARNVAKFKRNNGPSSYPYLPVTYVLPDDHMRLLQVDHHKSCTLSCHPWGVVTTYALPDDCTRTW
jgi:hypothetical protein